MEDRAKKKKGKDRKFENGKLLIQWTQGRKGDRKERVEMIE